MGAYALQYIKQTYTDICTRVYVHVHTYMHSHAFYSAGSLISYLELYRDSPKEGENMSWGCRGTVYRGLRLTSSNMLIV